MEKLQAATATRPVRELGARKGTVVQVALWTANRRESGYLKFLDLEGIVREALCWALARYLRLPMPQAYYVSANPNDLPGTKSGNPHNLAFGLEETGLPLQRIENRRAVEDRLENWKFALQCGVFDEWIANRDRIPNNLLFFGRNEFVLIDHDDALPAHVSIESHSNSEILRRLGENMTESKRQDLRQQAGYFFKRIQRLDWERIRLMVAHENVPEIKQDMFSRHIEFLQQRASLLPIIVSLSLGIRQVGLDLDNEIREKKEGYI